MKTLNYRIEHTLTGAENNVPVTYTVSLNNEVIKEGTVFSQSTNQPITIDISEICKEYIDVPYELLNLNSTLYTALPNNGKLAPIHTFTVESANGNGSYVAVYDYNTDWVTDVPNNRNLSYPIQLDIDERQYIGMTASNSAEFIFYLNNAAGGSESISATNTFALYHRKVGSITTTVGDKVRLLDNTNGVSYTYTVVRPCRNRYAVYYVNKVGGLDYLLCHGRSEDAYQADRTDMRHYLPSNNRLSFEQARINSNVHKRYNLWTGYLQDEYAANIDHLIYSPKVWIHDLDKDTITAAIVDTNGITVQKYINDGLPYYTFTLEDSKLYNRK